MGAGKTTVGRRLAAALGRRFLDLDAAVAGRAGRSVASLLKRDERVFRGLESAALRRAAKARGVVVALGGGTLLDRRNLAVVRRSGLLIWLTAPQAELKRRLRYSQARRPLLAGGSLRALMARRRAGYNAAALCISTAGRSAAKTAALLAPRLRGRRLS